MSQKVSNESQSVESTVQWKELSVVLTTAVVAVCSLSAVLVPIV